MNPFPVSGSELLARLPLLVGCGLFVLGVGCAGAGSPDGGADPGMDSGTLTNPEPDAGAGTDAGAQGQPDGGAFSPNDPLFGDQWHLRNTGQAGNGGGPGTGGEDLNVLGAWASVRGTGIRIAIVDDGLDITHPDLTPNVVAGESYDYTTGGTSPTPTISSHGTGCAGLAAAAGDNNLGVVGVAMNAKLVGYNLLQASTAANDADAMTRAQALNDVYSNSWGATDGTGALSPSAATWRAAIDQGVTTGRGGRGAVYTWAAGNGASQELDRSDYDGQATYRGVIAVASLTDKGTKASYSEPGSNLLVAGFGGEFCEAHTVTTTDVQGADGYNDGGAPTANYADADYSRCFNGTSAATPEISGVVALMLEANPALTWRDVRVILARTARRNDPTDGDWVQNGADAGVNHKYGYGAADATAAVAAARTWATSLTGAQKTASTASSAALVIPDNTGVAAVSTVALSASGITAVEFVDVTVTGDHAQTGELTMVLISPAGTRSVLMVPHLCAANNAATLCGAQLQAGNRFGVARLMGEPADGTWTLSVQDDTAGNSGSLTAWTVTVYGS